MSASGTADDGPPTWAEVSKLRAKSASLEGIVDADRLARWLDAHLPGAGVPLEITRVSPGASNEILRLKRGGHDWCLRRPGKSPIDPVRANAINAREFRLLKTLDATDVPHPNVLAQCTDLSVAGACFYVMDWVDGFIPRDPLPPPYDRDPAARRALGLELIDALAKLANVDWKAIGLHDHGNPEGFLTRQVERWQKTLAAARTARELPGVDAVALWLGAHVPPGSPAGIVHGDLQFLNAMFAHGLPARLVAMLDWEMSTLGDPLFDLGWVLSAWPWPGDPKKASGTYFAARESLPGFDEVIERYARHTGRDVGPIKWYIVLAWFKQIAIFEGAHALYLRGSEDPAHKFMGSLAPVAAASAYQAISTKRDFWRAE